MIRLERRERGIAWILIDNPQARNAMTFAMWEKLREFATELNADSSVRAVVIAGAAKDAFVSGTDIGEFRAFAGPDDGVAYEKRIGSVIEALDAIAVPAIAAIRGVCTGGGVSIAATCDVRIGGPMTRVGVPIARTLGNCISLRNIARLAEIVGLDAVKTLLLTGTLLGAREAHKIGFLTEVAEYDDTVPVRAQTIAEELVALAPLTLRATKEMCRRLRNAAPIPDDGDLIRLCYGSSDFREGLTAFLDKRKPVWTGS
ncbi:MAG TPA: enoyl-CoA hydratase [Candidatus Elarobacter sp.]|nr:enoyl-CoA hydratase [Candidatus Elarobacter sp.]